MSKRIVACWARQTGKTTTIALKVIHYAFTHAKATIIIVSRGLRQSMIMFNIIENLIQNNPITRKSIKKSTRTEIQLTNKSRIIALPCGSDGSILRGYTANLVIMDEAAFMPEDVINSVIFPMLATTNGTAIMLSTPWGQDHTFYRSFKNPNYWSQHVTADQCPLIKPSFLAEQRSEIGELRYKMEYQAEFIEDQNSFFKQDLIRECIEDYDLITETQLTQEGKIEGTYYLGADFGKKIDHTAIAILRQEPDDCVRLIHKKQFPLDTPYNEVTTYIQHLNQKLDIVKGCVDQSAVGESLVEEIRQQSPQIDGITFTAKTKQDILTHLQTRMEQKRLILPLDRALLAQINEQRYKFGKTPKPTETPTEKGTLTFYHPQSTHDDQLWALALATYATKQPQSEPYIIITR